MTLEQRLQQRLVEPAGVINTQQLHCHYQATQGTAGRLVQRLALPEQVKFRYGSGVLQPTAVTQRLQRQRTESADNFDGQWRVNPDSYSGTGKTAQTFVQTKPRSFQKSREIVGKNPTEISQKVTVMTKALVKETNHNQTTTPVSLVEKKPKFASSSTLGKTIQETGEKGSSPGTQPQLKINRKATLAEVNTLSRYESLAVQPQRDANSSTNPTVNPTQPETSSSSSPPYSKKSGTLRISRKATMTAANTSNVAIVQSKSIPDLPLAQTNSPSSSSTVFRKEDTEDTLIQAKNKPLSKGIIQTKLAEINYQPTGFIQKQQGNLPVQLSQKASIASNPTVVSTTPTQLSSSSELNRVWLKTTNSIEANTIEASKGLSTTSSHHQKLPLPLSINQINTKEAIARQTNVVDNSTVQLQTQGNSTTPMSSPETVSALPIDVNKVAEQVSRILARQLAVERERRGIGRWY